MVMQKSTTVFSMSDESYESQVTSPIREPQEYDPLADHDQPSRPQIPTLADQEEQDKKNKREALKQDLYLTFAFILMILVTSVIVVVKIFVFTDDPTEEETFRPLDQQVQSGIKYTGNGFLPCNGYLPCQVEYFPNDLNDERKDGQMAEWNGIGG